MDYSTPYVHLFVPYGVIHLSAFYYNLKSPYHQFGYQTSWIEKKSKKLKSCSITAVAKNNVKHIVLETIIIMFVSEPNIS